MPPRYKFVELTVVDDEALERVVNAWVGQGWQLDRIHFVTSDRSRRPGMAFVAFVREAPAEAEPAGAPRDVPPASGADAPAAVPDAPDAPGGPSAREPPAWAPPPVERHELRDAPAAPPPAAPAGRAPAPAEAWGAPAGPHDPFAAHAPRAAYIPSMGEFPEEYEGLPEGEGDVDIPLDPVDLARVEAARRAREPGPK